jgi:hypothetical protein
MSITSAGFSAPLLGRVTVGGIIAGIIIGVIFAPQIRGLPLVNRLPTA